MNKGTHDTEARELVALYDAKWALIDAQSKIGGNVIAALNAGVRLDEACEAFRSKHYPREGRVEVGRGEVWVMAPKGMRGRIVYDSSRAG